MNAVTPVTTLAETAFGIRQTSTPSLLQIQSERTAQAELSPLPGAGGIADFRETAITDRLNGIGLSRLNANSAAAGLDPGMNAIEPGAMSAPFGIGTGANFRA